MGQTIHIIDQDAFYICQIVANIVICKFLLWKLLLHFENKFVKKFYENKNV